MPPVLPALALVLGSAFAVMRAAGRQSRLGTFLAVVLAAASVVSVAAVRRCGAPARAARAAVERAAPRPRTDGGYVGAAACRACHPRQWATWARSYHRTMTQAVGPQAKLAPLADLDLEVYGHPVRVVREGAAWVADLVDPSYVERAAREGVALAKVPDPPRVRRPIVMTTGSHWMQTFWVPGARPGELRNVPVVWIEALGRFVPRETAFLRPPDAEPFHQVWNDNCLLCHATAGVPEPTRERTWATRTADLGIACEACHGPGAAHVDRYRNPVRRWLARRAGDDADHGIVNPADLPVRRANDVCGQCHSKSWINDVRAFLLKGFSYRPGDRIEDERTLVLPASRPDHPWLAISLERDPSFVRSFFWPDGTIRVSGRQLNGLVESACHRDGDLGCLDCHTMHGDEPNMQLKPGMDGDGACTRCHGDVAAAGVAHTQHPAGAPGGRCMDCHMPYTTFGLLRGLRSHRIDVPAMTASLVEARPNACELCHLDRTRAWIRRQLARRFGLRVPAAASDERARDETVAVGLRYLYEGDAAQRAVVTFAFGREEARAAAGGGWFAPHLARMFLDPYAAVRWVALRSIVQVLPAARGLFDPLAPETARAAAARAVVDAWRADEGAQGPFPPAVAVTPRRGADEAVVAHLRSYRDERPIELKE